MNQKVLIVDDEANVLQGYKRHLRKTYDIELALGGEAALKAIEEMGPFAVVVSDMQMPEMSGVELLKEVHLRCEHTVRVMLTGNADQKTAVDAVNDGRIFRFLNKPCPPEKLSDAIDAALEHHRLITAEAELLDKTLSGSVSVLTQVLSLVMPEAFGMTQEARRWARELAVRLDLKPIWQIEMAAMLMRVGCVSLPKETLERYLAGETLFGTDNELVAETPARGHDLLSSIPRLEPVAAMILAQNEAPQDPTPVSARVLRAIGDYQLFHRVDRNSAIERLSDPAVYDQKVVNLLSAVVSETRLSKSVALEELCEGMVLNRNVLDSAGRLLVSKGTEIHLAMIQKLRLLDRSHGVQSPIEVQADDVEALLDAESIAQEISSFIHSEKRNELDTIG